MDINCRKANKLLNRYIDNELNDKDTLFFENHIKNCSKCKEEFESLKLLINDVSQVELEKLPDGFSSDLHLKLVEESLKNERKHFKLRPHISVAASATLILAVAFGSGYYKKSTESLNNNLITASQKETSIPVENIQEETQQDTIEVNNTYAEKADPLSDLHSETADSADSVAEDGVSSQTFSKFNSRKAVMYAEYSIDVSAYPDIFNEVSTEFNLNENNELILNDEEFSKLLEILEENEIVINYVTERTENNLIKFKNEP